MQSNYWDTLPIISIIVPVYNSEKYLHRCIGSILTQSYKSFELILVDDGSTDLSFSVCEHYAQIDTRVRFISQENKGVSFARNVGLGAALGEYIMFVDSDDFLERNALCIFVELVSCGCYDLVCASYRTIYANGEVEQHKTENVSINSASELAMRVYHKNICDNFASTWCKLYKRAVIENNKIRFIPQVTHAEDYIFNLTYYRHIGKAILSDKIIYNYVRSDKTLSTTMKPKNFSDLLCSFTYEQKYFWDMLGEFDFVRFSNHYVSLIMCNLRLLQKEKMAFKVKIQIIDSLLKNKQFSLYIDSCRCTLDMRLVEKIYIEAIKSKRSYYIIYSLGHH